MADLTLKLTDCSTRKNLMSCYSPEEPVSKSSPMDVFLRVRGFTKAESKKKKDRCIEISNENRIIVHLPKDSATYKNVQNGADVKHQFTFSQIFGEDVDQRNFYTNTVHNTVQRFLWGENCLVFAYGATNSGKTHTVQGMLSNPGVLPRALDVIFNSIGGHLLDPVIVKPNLFDNISKLSVDGQRQERQNKERLLRWGCELDLYSNCTSTESRMASSLSSDESITSYQSCESLAAFKDSFSQIEQRIHEENKVEIANIESFAFSVWISFAEIYNEYVYDLFQPFANTRSKKRTSLKLSEDKRGNVYVKGLQRISVANADEAMKLLIVGTKNLRFAATALNQNSSRSHCIFNIEIIRTPDKENPRVATISRLSFCDLAGSERYNKTKSIGERLKEACNINTSLLVLGRCIGTLRSNQHINKESMKLIPFRESKLTRLFQYFFTHRSAVSMIVNISPEPTMCDESLHVLKFSALAEKVFIVPQQVKQKRTMASILMENASIRTSVPWLNSDDGSDTEGSESDIEREELFDYIEQLQSEIKKINREKEKLEIQIRKEVADEAAATILNMEKFYSEKLQQDKEIAEQYAEQRIALCEQQTEAARKRQKEDECDLEECDKELEEKDGIIEKLKFENEELKTEIGLLKNEIKALRQSNTRLSISQANIRRKSSIQLFENSYKDYKRKSSVDTSWLSISENESASYVDLERQYEQTAQKLATVSAQLLEANDVISKQNELVNMYEQKLANQADKKRRLTLENARREVLTKEFQNMKLAWNEGIAEEKENNDIENNPEHCPQNRSFKATPKKIVNTENSESDDSPKTPETVKKLFKPSANVLLTSPIDDVKENETNIHSRVLEQIQLE